MQMKYCLPTCFTVVHYQTKTITDPKLSGYLARHQHEMAQQCLIRFISIGQFGDGFSGND